MPGIYVHIPFCLKKCAYCDFASYPAELSRRWEYVDALLGEMSAFKGEHADTVYIGGGTPTCLEEACLERVLYGIRSTFDIDENAEFTVEANPKTLDARKARLLIKYGVNRISLGAQSFDDGELARLGRIHSAEDIYSTFGILRDSGFDNINIDLMYALPGQTIKTLSTSIDKVLKLKPEHLSCYGLKFEEGTPFYTMLRSGELSEADEDTFADMYDCICGALKSAGYSHYEISNFALDGRESRHNLKYWRCEDYLGFGASAASCVGRHRYANPKKLGDYLSGGAYAEDYTMSDDEAMREFVILGLRVIKGGVNKQEFKRRFAAVPDEVFGEVISRFSDFLINGENSLALRESACLVSNSIMCEFVK